MKKVYLFIGLIFSLLFVACDKSEDVVVSPSVVTVKSEVLESGGVILYGDFQNFSSEDELGFIISGNSNSFQIALTNPEIGQNKVTLNSGLYLNQEYRYNTYIKTSTEIYYGLEESFLSTGSKSVSFLSIMPTKGNYYDVVELTCSEKLETYNSNDVEVLFNNHKARVIKIEGSKIVCEVPYFNEDIVSNIKVKYFGKTVDTSLNFELFPPNIESVSKSEVAFSDEITIFGENFENGNNTNVKVFIDDKGANIIQRSKTELTVRIPNEVLSLSPNIKVISNLQEVTTSGLLTMKLPKINSFPSQANVFDEIELIGENFNPDVYKNKVYFEGTEANIIGGDSNRLRVKVPHGVYSNWEPSIKIEISDELQSPEYSFLILDASIEIMQGVDIPIIDFQVINDIIYVYGLDSYKPSELVIHKYSVEDNTFYGKQTIDLPFQGHKTFVKANGEYIYLYFNRGEQDFYKVNLVTGSINILADFPGEPRNISQIAVSNGNIFLGGGSTGGVYNNIDYNDFYEYNVVNNTWLQVPNLVADINTTNIYYNLYTDNTAFMITGTAGNSQEIYKFDGNRFNNLNKTIQSPYRDFIGRRYFFKEDIFYIIQDNSSSYISNKFRTYDTINNTWDEIFNILPRDYTIIGMFQYKNLVYLQTIDYFLDRHLLKLDLNKI